MSLLAAILVISGTIDVTLRPASWVRGVYVAYNNDLRPVRLVKRSELSKHTLGGGLTGRDSYRG